MIKFKAERKDGTPMVGLGISAGNVKELMQGHPIVVNLKDLGLPATEILIFYGQNERALVAAMKPFIGPDTVTHIDPRTLEDET